MKDKRKILLGTKDVLPQVNNDVYINLEIRRTSDELQTEIVNNDFNLRDQFNTERRQSLKFCIYGTLDSIYSDLDDLDLEIKTNHEDLLYTPRIEANAQAAVLNKIKTKSLSKDSQLSKNIFNKNKSSFYFLFELSPGIKNFGETKTLQVKINSKKEKVYAEFEIPFLFFDDDKNLIDFGNETVEIDLNGEEKVVENDFPFLYDTHWIKNEISLPRPLFLSFRRSRKSELNNFTVQESGGTVKFIAALDFPSVYGIEKAEVYIKKNETQKNPNDDFYFEPQKLSWDVGEQFKEVTIDIVDDLFVEGDEKLLFSFRDIEYAEKGKTNFELTIKNDDTPSILTFENGSQEIISTATTVNTFIVTDKPIKVPGQKIDLVLDQEKSTIIIGEDIENTGTEENPEYRKTIDLTQGLDLFEIEIKTNDNLKYDFTKTAVFKFENPTQNIVIGDNLNTFTLTIKDSMVTRFTKYIIDNDKNKGQGIFRLRYPTPNSISSSISFVNSSLASSTTSHIFTSNFKYRLSVVNDGEPIIYEDRMVQSGETVVEIGSTNGYEKFEFKLPSNDKINSEGRYFEKSKYKILITEISSAFGSNFGIPPSPQIVTFEDVEIKSEPLESSFNKSGKTYYLTSELYGVKTRLELLTTGLDSDVGIYNLIIDAGITAEDNVSLIKQKLRDTGLFNTTNSGFPFSNSGTGFDEQKISLFTSKVKAFLFKNPTLKPVRPFKVRQTSTNSVIDCKINGIMILNKLLTNPIENTSTFFNSGNVTEAKTKVLNARFEENPVVYTYFPEEKDPTYFIAMPVEPINF